MRSLKKPSPKSRDEISIETIIWLTRLARQPDPFEYQYNAVDKKALTLASIYRNKEYGWIRNKKNLED